ncbi:hypothetical protein [Nocardia takedensis]|uniref:hypothetical protein n=1 Tax=Nocardia takedensis TaxID=259390 RepID=UPI0002E712F7|nr:hypothetical protein [Nocardia takedensis]
MVSPTVPEAAPASSAPRPMNRLTADDDLFLKAHRIFGSKLLTQIAWRFDRQLSRDAVEALHAQLTQGFLARRVVRSRIPLARPWWAPATASMAPIWETDPVPEGGVLDWLAQQAEVDFDPADGRMWRLSAAPHGTGSLPSLVTSHVGADGGAVVFAVRDAVERISRGLPPDRHTSSGRLVGDTPGTGRLRADLADMRASLRGHRRGNRGRLAQPSRRGCPAPPPYRLASARASAGASAC